MLWELLQVASSEAFSSTKTIQFHHLGGGGLPILLKSFTFGLLAKIPQKAALETVTLVIQILFQ